MTKTKWFLDEGNGKGIDEQINEFIDSLNKGEWDSDDYLFKIEDIKYTMLNCNGHNTYSALVIYDLSYLN